MEANKQKRGAQEAEAAGLCVWCREKPRATPEQNEQMRLHNLKTCSPDCDLDWCDKHAD